MSKSPPPLPVPSPNKKYDAAKTYLKNQTGEIIRVLRKYPWRIGGAFAFGFIVVMPLHTLGLLLKTASPEIEALATLLMAVFTIKLTGISRRQMEMASILEQAYVRFDEET